MAFKKNYLDEDDSKNLGSGGIITAPGAQSGAPAGGGQAPAAGSGWDNLQQYLDVNAGQTGGLSDAFVGANQKVIDGTSIGKDLVEQTTKDVDKWSADEKKAKELANTIRTADLTGFDATGYKGIAGKTYVKPNYGTDLKATVDGKDLGYGDVLKSFANASDSVKNATDYGTQKATLQTEFGGSGNYGSGASALDTFMLRADPNSKQAIKTFQDTNKDYLVDPAAGRSAKFNEQVGGKLDGFFGERASAFDLAKGDMSKAVVDRRAAIEGSAGSALTALTAAKEAERQAEIDKYVEQATAAGLDPATLDFSQFGSISGVDEADALSQTDWDALASLEGLDGGESKFKGQTRGDAVSSFDTTKADKAINDATAAKLLQEYITNAEGSAEALKDAMDKGLITEAILAKFNRDLPPGATTLSMNNLQARLNPGTPTVGGDTASATSNFGATVTGKKKLW